MGEESAIKKSEWPQTVKTIRKDLQNIGLKEGMVVLVHSSLSSIGWVCGAAVSVILALKLVLKETGTLVMPVHSGDLSDPKHWSNPPVPKKWWPIIREEMPPFMEELTPSRGTGQIAECFRKSTGTLRSSHPHDSFCAWGKHAVVITSGHKLDFGLGEGSPLSKIYGLGGYVLLLGVDHYNNTSLHLAEYRANYKGKRNKKVAAPVLLNGKRKWIEFEDANLSCNDFEKIGNDFKTNSKTLKEGFIGLAKSQLFKQKEIVDFAVKWMEENRK